jgi:hypothetical protein
MGSSEATSAKQAADHFLSSTEILRHLTQMKSGEHNILVYPELECFRNVYPKHCKKLLEDNDIVIALPYYETVERFRSLLNEEGVDTQLEERKGNLILTDALQEFFGPAKDLLLFFVNMERRIKELGKNNLSVIVCMGAFHHYAAKVEEMLEYESLLDLSNVRNWKVLCCYDKEDFARLTDEQRKELMSRHCRRIFCLGDSETQDT